MVRLRVKFEKIGAVRFMSHKDTMRAFRRSFAAGGVPVCFSEGFNPHPRLSFGPSLRTGWEGQGEYLDVLLVREFPDFKDTCNANLPEGLGVVETAQVETSVPKLGADVTAARYLCVVGKEDLTTMTHDKTGAGSSGASDVSDATAALESHLQERLQPVEEEDSGGREPLLLEAKINKKEGEIDIDYLSTMQGGKSLFPEDLLGPVLGDPKQFQTPIKVIRKSLYVQRNGRYVSPISKGAVQVTQ